MDINLNPSKTLGLTRVFSPNTLEIDYINQSAFITGLLRQTQINQKLSEVPDQQLRVPFDFQLVLGQLNGGGITNAFIAAAVQNSIDNVIAPPDQLDLKL